MRSTTNIQRIADRLAQLTLEIGMLQGIGFTDINRSAQEVFRRVLSLAFDLPNLQNLDATQRANFPAIDLLDSEKRVAFQVTGDPAGSKIRKTIGTFKSHHLCRIVDTLKVYVVTRRQQQYRLDLARDLPPGFIFNPNSDVLDSSDLLRRIGALASEQQVRILDVLEGEFGEDGFRFFEVQNDELSDLEATFVAPREYVQASALVEQTGLVVLAGVPHVGKTTTALAILRSLKPAESGRILRLTSDQLLSHKGSIVGELILLDDAFGPVEYNRSLAADFFDRVCILAQFNKIIITTRLNVLEDSLKHSRLGERSDLNRWIVELCQEGSYSDEALEQIYLTLWRRRCSMESHLGATIGDTKHDPASYAQYVTRHLRFPHNIARFVSDLGSEGINLWTVDSRITAARDISSAAYRWFLSLESQTRQRVALALLLPDSIPARLLPVIEDLGLTLVNEATLARQSGGFLRQANTLRIGHPSYSEGILRALRTECLADASRVIRSYASQLQACSLEAIAPVMLAVRMLEPEQSFRDAELSPIATDYRAFYLRFLEAYTDIIGRDFPLLRAWFEPSVDWPIRVHIYLNSAGDVDAWTLLPRIDPDLAVTESIDDLSAGTFWTSAEREVMEAGWQLGSYSRYPDRHQTTSPEVEALERVWRDVERGLESNSMVLEGPTIRQAQIDSHLARTDFPLGEVSSVHPLTADWIRRWFAPHFDFSEVSAGSVLSRSRKPLMIKYTEGTVNDVHIESVAESVERLAEQGVTIEGRFLVEKDCPWDQPCCRHLTMALDGWFSDVRLAEAVRFGMEKRYTAIKETLELCFPTLAKRISRLRTFPRRVTAVIDREWKGHMSSAHVLFKVANGDESQLRLVEIDVYVISEFQSDEMNLEAKAVTRSNCTQPQGRWCQCAYLHRSRMVAFIGVVDYPR